MVEVGLGEARRVHERRGGRTGKEEAVKEGRVQGREVKSRSGNA